MRAAPAAPSPQSPRDSGRLRAAGCRLEPASCALRLRPVTGAAAAQVRVPAEPCRRQYLSAEGAARTSRPGSGAPEPCESPGEGAARGAGAAGRLPLSARRGAAPGPGHRCCSDMRPAPSARGNSAKGVCFFFSFLFISLGCFYFFFSGMDEMFLLSLSSRLNSWFSSLFFRPWERRYLGSAMTLLPSLGWGVGVGSRGFETSAQFSSSHSPVSFIQLGSSNNWIPPAGPVLQQMYSFQLFSAHFNQAWL